MSKHASKKPAPPPTPDPSLEERAQKTEELEAIAASHVPRPPQPGLTRAQMQHFHQENTKTFLLGLLEEVISDRLSMPQLEEKVKEFRSQLSEEEGNIVFKTADSVCGRLLSVLPKIPAEFAR